MENKWITGSVANLPHSVVGAPAFFRKLETKENGERQRTWDVLWLDSEGQAYQLTGITDLQARLVITSNTPPSLRGVEINQEEIDAAFADARKPRTGKRWQKKFDAAK